MTRTDEENRVYMSAYMKKKYLENKDEIKARNKLSYEKNKHSCLNQSRRLRKCIDNLRQEIILLVEHNEECFNELDMVRDELKNILDVLNVTD